MKDLSLGFIALFRQFLKWEWFTDVNTCHFMVYCLLRANKQAATWRGQKIKRGQFISSLNNMSKETGLTISQLRTCINKLSKTGEIASETSNQNSIITVKNYNEYQGINKRIARILAKEIANENRQYNRVLLKPIANDLARNLATNNNIDIYSNNNINTHTKEKNNVCVLPKISKEEREILKNYARKSKATNITAYVHTLIANGGYVEILEQEKQKVERRKQKEIAAAEKIEEVPEPQAVTEQGRRKARAAFEQLKKLPQK